jgi:NitT/TauT family transport system substrate-binding protein
VILGIIFGVVLGRNRFLSDVLGPYVKTLQWIHTHTADQIAAMMPPDYYANNKVLYVTALQNQLSIFSPDGNMPSDGPGSVLSIEQQTNQTVQGKQIDLSTTFTNEFTSKATG